MAESSRSESEIEGSASGSSMSFSSVDSLCSVVNAYGDEEQTICHSSPGGVSWSDEDERAMRKIDYDLLCMVDVSEKPDFQQFIQQELDRRWTRIQNPFLLDTKRPNPTEDEHKYSEYYVTKIADEESSLDDVINQDEGYGREAREHIAQVVQPGVDLEDKRWTQTWTFSKPRSSASSKAVVRSLIAVVGDRVILVVAEAFAEKDGNRYVKREGEGPTFLTPSGDLEAVAPFIKEKQALPYSELLFRHLEYVLGSDENVLDIVWHFNITNPMTRRTILGAHQAMEWGGRCWGRFRADGGGAGNTDQDRKMKEQKEFQNLVVTDNGRNLVWMMSNHREIFRERIKEIYTFPACSVPSSERFHMVFKLGKVEKGKEDGKMKSEAGK
ncbi:hypothetical protein Vi05172_g2097 [Venturia inaequalis]|nr:hypothetical protein Vi05172_g2097 [Venturia inaequalis]